MTPKYYAGIGRRKVPKDYVDAIHRVAGRLAGLGYTLRSGGAQGCDSAFEKGADAGWSPDPSLTQKLVTYKEIWLPWDGHFDRDAKHEPMVHVLSDHNQEECQKYAATIHPAWDKCDEKARKMHARNAAILRGPDLVAPVDFVLCWTETGCEMPEELPEGRWGGTGLGIAMAGEKRIPVFNLGRLATRRKIWAFLEGLEWQMKNQTK